MNKKILYIPPEKSDGCCEYKLKLIFEIEEVRQRKLTKSASQMKYRLYQGNGKAIYIIGVSDRGDVEGITREELETSVQFLKDVCAYIDARIYKERVYEGTNGFIGTFRIEWCDPFKVKESEYEDNTWFER